MTVAKTPGAQARRRAGTARGRDEAQLRALIEEAEFACRTSKTRWKIRQVGIIAADAVGRTVEETGADSDGSWIRYAVRDQGRREMLEFFLHIEGDDSAESRRVRLAVGDYVVSQRRFLGLIRVGPKSVEGHRFVRLFGQYLRQIL